MKKQEPSISHYILLRMSFMMVVLLLIYYLILTQVLHRDEGVTTDMFLMASVLTFVVAVTVIRGKVIEKKLKRVNTYLETLVDPKKQEDDTNFVTREFEDIWLNLRKVLNKARKREEDKSKYNTKLKLKNRQRSDMLSAIAHEFRNPISVIVGYAQTLQEDPNISRSLQERFLEKIYNNGQKIEDLLSRLILWNKFESGEARCYLTSFDIYALAQEISQSLKEKYKNRTIAVKGERSIVKGDRALIEIVLKNLIENALKYSSDKVTVKIEGKRIVVIDHGTGISKKDIGKVTKKFYRSGTHDWDNSMGLGLSIVKNILTLHNSTIEIESVEGEGSTFSFLL